jgi:hypothetical protein
MGIELYPQIHKPCTLTALPPIPGIKWSQMTPGSPLRKGPGPAVHRDIR